MPLQNPNRAKHLVGAKITGNCHFLADESIMTNQTQADFFQVLFKRVLPDEQTVSLVVILMIISGLIYFLAGVLMPVFASIVIAYLLEGLVAKAENLGMPRLLAVCLVFSAFMVGLGFILFYLIPLVSQQTFELMQNIPDLVERAKYKILRLPQVYPTLITENRTQQILLSIQRELLSYGQNVLAFSAASVMGLASVLIYLFLMPMLVFFFLKDKQLFISWVLKYIPKQRNLTMQVWQEVDTQIGNYVRGKITEVIILWVACYIAFATIGLNYAMLLSLLIGLSVIIPYIGATLVTFPVVFVAYFQWGFQADEFMYVLIAYAVIQAVDAVVLIPFLFSEAVNLHAVAIIIAILFFGGLWGFWGVFFAIPLATVVKAVLNAWPRFEQKFIEEGGKGITELN